MRFQDWDVLLFPHGSHVPIREFRTACFAQQDTRTMSTTPLLTCFVPSLTANAPFQVSVHTWVKPASILGANNAGYVAGAKYQWRIKIVVEGNAIANETFPEDVDWPRQIVASSTVGAEGRPLLLSFPRFHSSILSQTHWNACDDLGRIKIQLSAGYETVLDGKPHFVKLVDHVVFSFQPAPLEILERSGIAWPNATLPVVNNPLQAPDNRRPSLGGGRPFLDDSSSRSTSAYSVVPPTAYPPQDVAHPPISNLFPELMKSTGQQQMQLRLPSDQLQKIIDALSDKPAASNSMPPPPVPPQRLSAGTTTPVMDRRGVNYSDISMHNGCINYPSCISEDADGQIVHINNPSTVIRGRKEGSSPAKPRDFLSTVMDVPAHPAPNASSPPTVDSSVKKRTRSALRTLTINDGSPEKKEKPARKVSRTVSVSSDKENSMVE